MQFHQHPTLVTILLSLSLLHLRITDALYFRLNPLIASLTTIPTSDPPTYGDATRPSPASPSERYYDVTFTVSNPDAVWEQGGRGEVYCDVYWQAPSPPPSCWQPCSSSPPSSSSSSDPNSLTGAYFARISPGGFVSVGDFALDIWQGYIYEIGNHNNATVVLKEDDGGWECARSVGTNGIVVDRCEVGKDGPAVEKVVETWHNGADPGNVCGREEGLVGRGKTCIYKRREESGLKC
ncbi:uncharacterized protein K489DRAFT_384019 [Dissoconium aciculare CBS 342.82]|uniref:Uncharacterized protein n=1 Tax=Dissoconium aciculare CBS 342.82 TaxID=1314786 RepID=A0A6J3LTK6_9PEZI|nr:uncharacterized protein K489DRAFT_384019 [Dissoconium aciculare CBS 342.82]KAF1819120.1 hypothetical protein K489DRAFT_384019 [Dissoconium aciculare CBS 342.82]